MNTKCQEFYFDDAQSTNICCLGAELIKFKEKTEVIVEEEITIENIIVLQK